MLTQVILIFLGGIVLDILTSRYTRCVAGDRPVHAAALSGVITLGNLALWGSILQQAETLGLYGAFAMAGGSTVGTLIGAKSHIK